MRKIDYSKGVVRLNKRGHVGIVFSSGLYSIVDSLDIDITKKDFMNVSKNKYWEMFDKEEILLSEEDLLVLFHYLGDAILLKIGKKVLGKYDFVKICHILFMNGIFGKNKWSLNISLDCLKKVKP